MSQDDGAERSHEPTPQKLEEARRKGEIVKSQDISIGGAYVGVLGCLAFVAPNVGTRFLNLGGTLLAEADRLSEPLRLGTGGRSGEVLGEALTIVAFFVSVPTFLVLAALLAQRAFVFAPEKLIPKLSRISLVENAKNKFGPRGLFEFGKSAAKMALYGAILTWFLWRNVETVIGSAGLEPGLAMTLLPKVLIDFVIPVAIVSLMIAVIDYAWQRHAHLTKNRMTRQEVLDETKRSEGDPEQKSRRRQRAQEIAMNSMLADVPEATVVVVNPTHYAVALKWSPEDPSPPICLAKGVDLIAARIREVAKDADVPIFSDPPTARALHATVEIGDPIEREHFAAVAAAIRFARALNDKAAT